METTNAAIDIYDLHPAQEDCLEEVIAGMARSPKRLPSKLFYDERGSRLFERICQLAEYYLTRTELAIMRGHAGEMAAAIGPDVCLIELGSGASVKTRILLDHLERTSCYVPIDISRDHLQVAARSLRRDYPQLQVLPICADFTRPLELPDEIADAQQRVVYFPGSTIGNFEPHDAVELLRNVYELCSDAGGLLIGVDRKKDVAVLEAAYNDAQGVTAEFNRNMLRRINDDLGADFAPQRFEHHAFYSRRHGRIEMHLRSQAAQVVHLDGKSFALRAGESICTEYSYKYTLQEFTDLAAAAGFRLERSWSDSHQRFGVLYFSAQ